MFDNRGLHDAPFPMLYIGAALHELSDEGPPG